MLRLGLIIQGNKQQNQLKNGFRIIKLEIIESGMGI